MQQMLHGMFGICSKQSLHQIGSSFSEIQSHFPPFLMGMCHLPWGWVGGEQHTTDLNLASSC